MPALLKDQAEQCAELIRRAENISALTGAGISTSAGIPDFRGPQGLYVTRRYDPDTVFDINYFRQNPKPFYQFARDFLTLEDKIRPTFAHKFLAGLEAKNKLQAVITQNIDSLHQLAGSKNIFEMHGSFWSSRCLDCGEEFDFALMKKILLEEDIPECVCGGVIKPDIVFFGENVKYFNEAIDAAANSDLFFVIGTSCVVYPAAMVPQYTKGKIVVVNNSPVELTGKDVVLHVKEDIDEFFEKVAEILF